MEIESGMLYYDAIMCLTEDSLLKDGYFEGVNAAVLVGAESTLHWRREMRKETDRLGLPLHHASVGDIFCAYASFNDLLAIIRDEAPAELKFAG